MTQAQWLPTASRIQISREILGELRDLDPTIDLNWRKRVGAIMQRLGGAERKYVYSQFLEPKGIRYLPEEKQFVFEAGESLQTVVSRVSQPGLMHVAKKLVGALDALRKAATPTQFADYLEASLSLLDRFDSAEDLTVQKTKNALRSAFLTELVSATRNAGFKVEPNRRGLSAQSIKDFIIEVFLKQQFMGYRFRTLSVNVTIHPPTNVWRFRQGRQPARPELAARGRASLGGAA
jgi:serine/threonine-protein kinase PpkA